MNKNGINKKSEKEIIISLGAKIREMRYSKGIGIKKLAPALRVDYSYLSKVENDKVLPSVEVLERISTYFGNNKEELMLLADKIPDDIRRIFREHPEEALKLLRRSFISDGEKR